LMGLGNFWDRGGGGGIKDDLEVSRTGGDWLYSVGVIRRKGGGGGRI
jgi:hypothetical protein